MAGAGASFRRQAAAKAADDGHRRKLAGTIATYDAAVAAMKAEQFVDWQAARAAAAAIKGEALARLPDLLETFETRLTERGAEVVWAADAADARRAILDVARTHGARRVVKSKSMTTEEVGLNECLEAAGIEVCETDLGELIVQFAGEKPYHIVTPAMHKSQAEIGRLFHARLGISPDAPAEDLTMAARAHLRGKYVAAEIGITGANFIIADEGAIGLTENEGNGRLTMACPPVHVVIVGLEKVIPRLTDLSLFLPLLATSGTGQQLTGYNSIVRGPRRDGEVDGPERMVVILLDNGRSALAVHPVFRQALHCIRCGACLNACPVYRTIGGHAYGTAYSGPIGSILTPLFKDLKQWQHMAHASTLCGACARQCPVGISLNRLLLATRVEADRRGVAPRSWRLAMRLWAAAVRTRARVRLWRRLYRLLQPLVRALLPAAKRRRVPKLARCSFADQWGH